MGLTEFKKELGNYIARAKGGDIFFITERGHVVAKLSSASQTTEAGRTTSTIDELRRKGLLSGKAETRPLYIAPMPRTLVSTPSMRNMVPVETVRFLRTPLRFFRQGERNSIRILAAGEGDGVRESSLAKRNYGF